MFFSNIHCQEQQEIYPAPVQYAINYLKRTEFSLVEPGTYELDKPGYELQVIDMETGPVKRQELEAHRSHVDVQFLASGQGEGIGYAPGCGAGEVLRDESEFYDILYYKKAENEVLLPMYPGSFAVFFPWDIHRPGCILEKRCTIRKIVIKIEMSLFNN